MIQPTPRKSDPHAKGGPHRDSDEADGLSDAEISVMLNSEYQWTIPSEFAGMLYEGEWELATVAGQDVYPFPDFVHSIRSGARIDGKFLMNSYYGLTEFWEDFDRTNTNQAQPKGILYYSRTVTVRPVPDKVYTIRTPTREFPRTPLVLGETGNDRLNYDIYAKAVVSYALVDYLLQIGDEPAAQVESQRLKGTMEVPGYEKTLRRYSMNSKPREVPGGSI